MLVLELQVMNQTDTVPAFMEVLVTEVMSKPEWHEHCESEDGALLTIRCTT